PCVTFNEKETFKYYNEMTQFLPEGYRPEDRVKAVATAMTEERLHLGTFYKEERPVYTDFADGAEAMKSESLLNKLFERFK
ncbi:MAG: hypothetical protein AAB275_05370, partial [Deltaproteobacteria bacterium]